MYAVRELTLEPIAGADVWNLLRDFVRHTNKKWPSVNAKLLASWHVASNKAWVVTEHKSTAAYEAYNKAWEADEGIQNLYKRMQQMQTEAGGRWLFTSFRDMLFTDTSELEPK